MTGLRPILFVFLAFATSCGVNNAIDIAKECTHVQCPPGSMKDLRANASANCGGGGSLDLTGNSGSLQGQCLGAGACTIRCLPPKPCCKGEKWTPAQYSCDEPCCEGVDGTPVPCDNDANCGDDVCNGVEQCNVACDGDPTCIHCEMDCCGTCGDGECLPPDNVSNCPQDCACVRNCNGKVCGDDGCGGLCGSCPAGKYCNNHACTEQVCTPDCVGKVCGTDGCSGTCGSCPKGSECSGTGQCVEQGCTVQCAGKECGDNGCGGNCGICGNGLECNFQGKCVDSSCKPQCTGKSCGDDGCGGSCGTCPAKMACSNFTCVNDCTPKCIGKACGDDGCGGSCGPCNVGLECVNNKCVDTCSDTCVSGQCGDVGCGSICPCEINACLGSAGCNNDDLPTYCNPQGTCLAPDWDDCEDNWAPTECMDNLENWAHAYCKYYCQYEAAHIAANGKAKCNNSSVPLNANVKNCVVKDGEYYIIYNDNTQALCRELESILQPIENAGKEYGCVRKVCYLSAGGWGSGGYASICPAKW